MQKLPQIVRERLKAGSAVTAHPSANLLAAFAEHSLLERERAHVLAHLSSCPDCREILALALPPIDTETLAAVAVAVRRSWFVRPAFRWGFATAGVALIGLGIVESEHHRPAKPAIVARQLAPAGIATEMKKEVVPAPAVLAPSQNPSNKGSAVAKKDEVAQGRPRLHHQTTESRPHSADLTTASGSMVVAKLQTPGAPSPTSQMLQRQAHSMSVNAPAVDSKLAQASPENGSAEQSFGYNSGPLSRAKPADIEPVQPGAVSGTLSTSRWSISAAGGLQRSLDQGKTWQDINVNATTPPILASAAPGIGGEVTTTNMKQQPMVAPLTGKVAVNPIFFRAVIADRNEVWAGGSNTALFHSIDGGNHWTRVLPSSAGVVLSGDILSVEFSDIEHGTVTTSTPQIWTTTDDGQTWQKQ